MDEDLRERAATLLRPGEIDLLGAIVHTDLGGDEDLEMQELTVEAGEVIAEHAGKGEAYVYAGNDDPEFASNQFQGRTLGGEEFVWECQQLLREGSFDLVFYYEATADHGAILRELRAQGHEVTGVEPEG